MDLNEAQSYIFATNWKDRRPGLDRMRELLCLLGSPEQQLKYVHVAGTNGKGSVCAMLSSILSAAGYRTGLYTSPHLAGVNERFVVNGEEITDEDFIHAAERVKAAADRMCDPPTAFEILTAMAFCYFAEQRCDIVVLEVGLGGRLDATNVIPPPEAAVITNLGLEHTEILGDTIEEIAFEKGGIIKSGTCVVSYDSDPKALSVLRNICNEKGVPFKIADMANLTPAHCDLSGQYFNWKHEKGLFFPLLGEHQLHNANLALEAISVLRERGWKISDDAVRKGLAMTRWPARFEVLALEPVTILDGAHNPQCAQALANSLSTYLPGERATFLMGVLSDKDCEAMISAVATLAKRFVCVTPDSERAFPAKQLSKLLALRGFEAEICESIEEGIEKCLSFSDGPVVAFGSLYMAGAVRSSFFPIYRRWLRKKKIQAREALTPEERERLSGQLIQNLVATKEFQSAKTVLVYRGTRGEVRLDTLFTMPDAQGKRFAYPLCVSKTEMLALIPREDAWAQGSFGIWEPVPERSDLVMPEEIDLVVCPCTAFDEQGNRMGMGGGYYDRYLPKCVHARILAVAFECQKAARIPAAVWDKPMELVVTEKAVYRPRRD